MLDPDAIVDPLLDTMTAVAAATLEACWNAADWDAVASLVTPRFLQTALGIDAPDVAARAKALAALQLGPLRIETIGPVGIWSDGRGAVDVLYFRGRGNPSPGCGGALVPHRGAGCCPLRRRGAPPAPAIGRPGHYRIRDRRRSAAIAVERSRWRPSPPLSGDRAPWREPGLEAPYLSIGRDLRRNPGNPDTSPLATGRPRAARSPRRNLPSARPRGRGIGAGGEGDG